MKYFVYISLFFLSASAWTCKSNQYASSDLPDKQLCFGNGGGVVGKENRYIMLENGQVFYSKLGGSAQAIGSTKVKSKKAEAFFQRADAILSANRVMTAPGNTYEFLELRQGDTVKRIAWDDQVQAKDPELKGFYDELMAAVK